jgi:hypothetical protein
MSKPFGLTVLLCLVCLLSSQSAFARPAGQSPQLSLASEECPQPSDLTLFAADAPDATHLPSVPGMTPKPIPLFPWICGNCSQPACLDLYEGADCDMGSYTGTCYASFATLCSTTPKRYYCGCF